MFQSNKSDGKEKLDYFLLSTNPNINQTVYKIKKLGKENPGKWTVLRHVEKHNIHFHNKKKELIKFSMDFI